MAAITATQYNSPLLLLLSQTRLLPSAAGVQGKVTTAQLSRVLLETPPQQPTAEQAVAFFKPWAKASQHTLLQPRLSQLPHAKQPTQSIMRAHVMETPQAASSTLERREINTNTPSRSVMQEAESRVRVGLGSQHFQTVKNGDFMQGEWGGQETNTPRHLLTLLDKPY